MSMITASLWVPRGAAQEYPTRCQIDEDELARISKLAKLQLNDARGDLELVQNGVNGDDESHGQTDDDSDADMNENERRADDDLTAYDLENYDNDEVDEAGDPVTMFGNARSLAFHQSNSDDPYLTGAGVEEDEDGEEKEELRVLPTDNMLVAAKVEDEVPYLEVYVYEDEADNLYVHHDIMLPAIPLAIEWMDLPVGRGVGSLDKDSRGSCVAVGTMDPDIELWDLDKVDSMYPDAILGAGASEDTPKKKKKRNKKVNDQYHVDAVMALSANRHHRNLLASGSADKTIKVWDLTTAKCVRSTGALHTDKVCSLDWHPVNGTSLLSGSYDRSVVTADLRMAQLDEAATARWTVESDVETVMWDRHNENMFFVTTEDGMLHMFDARNSSTKIPSPRVWQLQAHDKAISCMDVNPVIPGFLATGSADKEVKIWDIRPSDGITPSGPSLVVSRNVDVGRVFSTRFGSDSAVAFRLSVAGSKGALQIWDTSTNQGVRRAFAQRQTVTNGVPPQVEEKVGNDIERIVGLAEDSSDEEEEGGVEPGGEANGTRSDED